MKRTIPLLQYLVILTCCPVLTSQAAMAQGTQKVLAVQGQAVAGSLRAGSHFQITLDVKIADGYHINAHIPSLDYLIATAAVFEPPKGFRLGEIQYPAAQQRKFEFAPETPLAVYEKSITITAPVEVETEISPPAAASLIIHAQLTAQACTEGQCLAPATIQLDIPVKQGNAGAAGSTKQPTLKSAAAAPIATGLVQFGSSQPADNPITGMIASRGFLFTLLLIFLAGLALNTTPCVYPIIPITISFFANQSSGKMSRTFGMACCYVLGMATTYSVLGVAASLSKGLFGAALQQPPVLVFLALIMIALALSMFDLYEFRLPLFLNRLVSRETQSARGLGGALLMGLSMGVVAAPCIGPLVAGLLVHVGSKGDPLYGFCLFFVLALGLGFPYLILGTFSGALSRLPRSGQWMVTVRKFFGFVLLGMALYFLMPLLGRFAHYSFALLLLAAAAFFLLVEARQAKPKQFGWILAGLSLALVIMAIIVLIPATKVESIAWQPFSYAALENARAAGKPLLVDVYADWCIPCKELDKVTFSDPAVGREAGRFVALKLNLTQISPNSEAARAKEQFAIQGVPTIMFLDAAGNEKRSLRLEGFEKPELFLKRLGKMPSASAP